MEFKDRIKELRVKKNLTTTQLAAEFAKSDTAIRMWETGKSKPDADTLIKLSVFFDTSTDYLLGVSEFKSKEHKQDYDAKYQKLENLLSDLSDNDRALFLDFYTRYLEAFSLAESEKNCYDYALQLTKCLDFSLYLTLFCRYIIYDEVLNKDESTNTEMAISAIKEHTMLSHNTRKIIDILNKNVDDTYKSLENKGIIDFYFADTNGRDPYWEKVKAKGGDNNAKTKNNT